MKKLITLWAVLVFTAAAQATFVTVDLTKDSQGKGNKGTSFRPVDDSGNDAPFVISAWSMLDPAQPENPAAPSFDDGLGTVYVGKDGVGVKTNGEAGSKGISGISSHKNEELIFEFDNPMPLGDLSLGIANTDYNENEGNFGNDNPVLFLSASITTGVFEYTVTEHELAAHFQKEDPKGNHGFILLGDLNDGSIPDNLTIGAFKFRETAGHTVVSKIAIPEPATICLLGLSCFVLVCKSKYA